MWRTETRNNTNFDWHSCAVQPKWEEAFLSFQSLVTNSKLQEKKKEFKHSNLDEVIIAEEYLHLKYLS